MTYSYGVGDVGLNTKDYGQTVTDRLYLACYNGKNRVLGEYVAVDGGSTYRLDRVLRRIDLPIHTQDNMPVYWHEGSIRPTPADGSAMW